MRAVRYLLLISLFIAFTNASLLDFLRLKRNRRFADCCTATVQTCCPAGMMAAAASPDPMDEESRDMYNAWNAPVKLGVFINPEANEGEAPASKRADTPFHPGGSGSGSGDSSYFTSDSAKRNNVPKPETSTASVKPEGAKQENVKKSTIETNEKKSELSAKATIEEVQGAEEKEKRTTTVTCQGQKDWLQCPTYQLIKIKDAFWGRDDDKTCSRTHTERALQSNKMCAQDESNTMTKLQNACDGESACELVASPVYFDRTDCPDVYKFLRVNWECAHSESRIKN